MNVTGGVNSTACNGLGDKMRKKSKRIISLVLVAIMVFFSATTVNAEMVYQYNNYRYTILSSDSISLYDRTDTEPNLFIPAIINNLVLVDIRNYAFYGDLAINSVDFSDAYFLHRIGNFAFCGCTNLVGDLRLSRNLNTIGTAAFQNTGVSTVEFSGIVSVVPKQCFYQCDSLYSVVLTSEIKSIEDYAFANCPNLEYIEIPESVNSIAATAFDKNTITLGVYTDSYAHQYAVNQNIPFILLDAPVVPTEPPTEAPTEAPTEPVIPTEEPTIAPTEQPTETSGYYLGDVNGDNTVDVIDSTLIQRYLASVAYPDTCVIKHGDVDGDGVVTILDATYIGRYNARIEVRYPIGEWQAE